VAIQTASIRVISFALLATCGTFCQSPPPVDLPQRLQSEMAGSLPDAPSTVQLPTSAARFSRSVHAAGSSSTPGVLSGAMDEAKLGYFTPGRRRSSATSYPMAFVQNEPNGFVERYLLPPPLSQDTHYYASTSDSFMGRASYAASRIFVTRDNSGKSKLNTRYFLGALSAVAMHAAYRPYGARSTSETFNNFGSTIGGDAGINIFHEFRPGIRLFVKGLTPKFVSRIEQHMIHDPFPK